MRTLPGYVARLTLCALAAIGITACAGGGGDGSAAESQQTTSARADSDSTAKKKQFVVFADYVNPEDSLPRLRYREGGLVSINDRCAVRKVKLNPRMPAAYVNGRPVGFC